MLNLLYLAGASCGGAFGLLAFLAPQKTVRWCIDDPLQLRPLGNFVVRALGVALLLASLWSYQQSGGLPDLRRLGERMLHYSNSLGDLRAPAGTPSVPYGKRYRQLKHEREHNHVRRWQTY